MDDPDRLGPYTRRTLREGFSADLREPGDGGYGVVEC